MKVAVSGKGGSGKTTITGVLARLLARSGHHVLAIDADPNPNLAVVLGLRGDQALAIAPIPRDMAEWRQDAGGRAYVHLHQSIAEIERQYGVVTPDDITLLVTGRIDHAGVGCMCDPHAIARGLIARVNAEADDVVTDMEAGLEHLSRGTVENVDVMLVILEPYYRSLETGARAWKLGAELGVPRLYAVGNKVRTEDEQRAVHDFCAQRGMELIGIIPFDPALPEADRIGISPLDFAAQSPAMQAIRDLAAHLEQRVRGDTNGHRDLPGG